MRKFWGVLLIVIGILFVFIAVGRITSLISNILGIVKIFDSNISAYQRGQIFGGFFYWMIHFGIIYFSLKYGSRLTKKKTQISP